MSMDKFIQEQQEKARKMFHQTVEDGQVVDNRLFDKIVADTSTATREEDVKKLEPLFYGLFAVTYPPKENGELEYAMTPDDAHQFIKNVVQSITNTNNKK